MAKRIKRDIFSGKYVEEEFTGSGVIASDGKTRQVKQGNGHWRKWESNSIAVNPAQAEHFNNQLRESGVVGAEYSPRDGKLRASSGNAAYAAAALRGFHNHNSD